MKLSSKNRLMPMHRDLFPDDTLFHRIARAVCRAGVLPRKELYNAWETARRVRRLLMGHLVCQTASNTSPSGSRAHCLAKSRFPTPTPRKHYTKLSDQR